MSLILGIELCEDVRPPTYLSFFTASSSILITFVAFVGNSLVVIAVIWNPYKDLRKPFYYFVMNLSIADLLVGLILGPLSTMCHFLEGLELKLPGEIGTLIRVVFFILCTASLLSLTALALERYLTIIHPQSYQTRLHPARAFLLVSVVVWITSFLLSMIFFISGYNRYRFIFANTTVAVIIATLIFTNAKILKYLQHQMQQWDDLHKSTEENMIMRQLIMWEKKMTNTLVIVILLFLAFYPPSCIFIYIFNFCTECDCLFINWIRDIQWLLVMATSAVNPFVYPWRLENFRRSFRRIVKCPRGEYSLI